MTSETHAGHAPTCIELFAGCGGMALGVAQAGFRHLLVAEVDQHAVRTLVENKHRGVSSMRGWPLHAGDVRSVDYGTIPAVDLVAGGPPCQPFSIGGRHAGPEDERNMWPEALRAVRELAPRAFLFENVRGLLRPAFGDYLRSLTSSLRAPGAVDRRSRTAEHVAYHVAVGAVNAADYGAAQKRHRAIVMGIRTDVAPRIEMPAPTHSRTALVWDQWVSGDYWRRHALPPPSAGPSAADETILKMVAGRPRPSTLPWRTVRDAIGDLPEPTLDEERPEGHRLHPGARLYPRHTGSGWDEPAKALKAGAHGVPGGENIIVSESGEARYFTLREMMRLQGFPDGFVIPGGGWKYPVRQIGNAVPVEMASAFARFVRDLVDVRTHALAA